MLKPYYRKTEEESLKNVVYNAMKFYNTAGSYLAQIEKNGEKKCDGKKT